MFFRIVLLLVALNAGRVLAQTPTVWSFKQCVEHALKENISVKQAMLNLEQSGNDLISLRLQRIPAVNATVNQSLNTGRVIDPFTNTFNEQTINSASFNLNSSVTLFNGFALNNSIRQQAHAFMAGKYDLELTKNNMVLSLANFFLQVLQQKELVAMAKAQRDNSKAQVERNQKLFDAGALRADILNNLKAQLANEELTVVNAENSLQLAKVNLQLLMMLKVSDNFDILAPKAKSENYARALAAGIDELFKESAGRNPQIKGAEFREKAADYGFKVAQAGHYPRLNLFGNLNTLWSDSRKSSIPGSTVFQVFPIGFVGNSLDTVFGVQGIPRFRTTPFADQLSDNLGTTLGLGLSIPIFSQGQIRNNVRRARTNQELAKLNTEQQKNTLYQDIARAFTDFKAAMLRHQANQENLKAQKEAYQFSSARFEQGLLNSADFLLAKNNAQRAEAALIQSQYELMFREKILEFYRGGQVEIND